MPFLLSTDDIMSYGCANTCKMKITVNQLYLSVSVSSSIRVKLKIDVRDKQGCCMQIYGNMLIPIATPTCCFAECEQG